ncbi:MAG: hypothetical protein ACHQX3_00340 [Nitrospirales bacterium]
MATLAHLFLESYSDMTEFHHGDCIGADAQAHELLRSLLDIRIIGHPPTDASKRAFTDCDELRKERPYLDRNRDIVNDIDILIVVPKTHHEERRSGTWATYRYAKSIRREMLVVWPDGSITPYAS